jgi:hypothetical protein
MADLDEHELSGTAKAELPLPAEAEAWQRQFTRPATTATERHQPRRPAQQRLPGRCSTPAAPT